MLLNVSELREYVMEARMIAEICWDSATAFSRREASERYVDWWSREYFGEAAAAEAAQAYRGYYQQLASWDAIAVGANAVIQALTAVEAKFDGARPAPLAPDAAAALAQRSRAYQPLLETTTAASAKMTPDRRQYFYEHVTFPLLLDSRQITAALTLIKAADEPNLDAARRLCFSAFEELTALEADIRRAERPPFENWYRRTWIRNDDSPYNVASLVRAATIVSDCAFPEAVIGDLQRMS